MNSKLSYACLALLISSLSASAITVTQIEDSVTRTWFSVFWGVAPFAPLAQLESGPISDAGGIDNNVSVHVDAIHPMFMDQFDINFAVGSRLFSTAAVNGFAGVQLLPFVGSDYGVQVVYGEPVPENGAIPDTGRSAALLCLASIALFSARQFFDVNVPKLEG